MILNLGYGNVVMIDKVTAIVNIKSAPIKKLIAEARERGLLIDVSQGRKSRSAVITDNNQIFLTAVQTETMVNRLTNGGGEISPEDFADTEE